MGLARLQRQWQKAAGPVSQLFNVNNINNDAYLNNYSSS
jgi:hypothetical protein